MKNIGKRLWLFSIYAVLTVILLTFFTRIFTEVKNSFKTDVFILALITGGILTNEIFVEKRFAKKKHAIYLTGEIVISGIWIWFIKDYIGLAKAIISVLAAVPLFCYEVYQIFKN